MIDVDTSELDDLADDFDQAAEETEAFRKVISKGALNIKNDARRRIAGHPHVPTYPYTIGYDIEVGPNLIEAEIGPDKEKVVGGGPFRTPGNLGAILEYGTINNAPIPHLGPALDTEAPLTERYLADAAEKLATGR